MAKVIVIQFPGVNCEYETLRAIEAAGLDGEIKRWNAAGAAIANAAAIVIPGGFSYQDRIRAGVVASKDPILEAVMNAVDRGVPVLGSVAGISRVSRETSFTSVPFAGYRSLASSPSVSSVYVSGREVIDSSW